ncbi:hypothetical protein OG317_00090 [Streptomyces sp. NBC_01167]|uniref:hypothetical protein n=1 Tax=Streptomyces sp. NBC_01167 TaxID=2903756 RepID=UPI003865C1E4|nr:hypothetical protein OG317_00090 [Streptomyces sp. NBC_01167]
MAKKDAKRTADTSYLGKLFVGKPLPEGTRFTLIVNETPAVDLYPFACERGGKRDPVSSEVRAKVVGKLAGLSLPDSRDAGWCVDRLDVLITARTTEHVESEAHRRLVPLIKNYLGQEPLVSEVDEVSRDEGVREERRRFGHRPSCWDRLVGIEGVASNASA